MKKVIDLIKKNPPGTELQDRPTIVAGQLSTEQIDLITWVFLRLETIYGNKFLTAFPDDDKLKMVKREWAEQIVRYDMARLEVALQQTKQDMMIGIRDAQWPDIAYVLGHCRSKSGLWA